jgi:signal transduction histidine kinase
VQRANVGLLDANVDYLTLVGCSLGLLGAVTLWLRRRGAGGGWPLRAGWAIVALALLGGYFAVEHAAEHERERLARLLNGMAPTYAVEMEQLGHAAVNFDTPPDDPRYLAIITAQTRWLAANREVADVYTIRRRADGTFAFLVDSETDYDHDGRLAGDREMRTPIGEAFADEDGSLAAAWAGHANISAAPVTDRWGTWISASVPMRDPATGEIEAICGVDYPAATWLEHIATARREMIATVAMLIALAGGAAVTASLQRARVVELGGQVRERERAGAMLAEAKEQAESANRAKSIFLANMSHELRTPLTAVLGFADLLRMPAITPEQRQEWSATIRRNGAHLLSVINDILDLSKIEAGKLSLEILPVAPAAVLEEVASLMRVRAAEKGIALRVHAPADLPPRVMLDPTRLRQILMNLVGNAIKFTTAGSVTIVARFAPQASGDGAAADGIMTIDVIDTGIGMAADALERLFQPFEQADLSTTRQYGGTGLGLTISRRLAGMMNAAIRVKSTPGRGSTFTLELPVRIAAASSSNAGDEAVSSSQQVALSPTLLAGVRVLVADDAPENAKLIRHQLESAGVATVVSVGNGVDACRAVHEAAVTFDVILLDMQMPLMDGYAAAAQIRRDGFRGAIVALTANAMAGDRDKCIAAGCDDYATKPIDARRLIDLVHHHARRGPGSGLRRSA